MDELTLSAAPGEESAPVEGVPLDALVLGPKSAGADDLAFVEALGPQLARLARIARLFCGETAVGDELLAEAISRSLVPWRRGSVTDPVAYVRRVMVNLLARRARRLAQSRRRDHRALDWLPTTIPTRTPSICGC